MAVPISFPSTTSNFDLPLLFSGQAQKEFFVNQSITLIDSIMRHVVQAALDTPPTGTAEGSSYLVAANATGDWADHEDEVAVAIGGSWHFISPQIGMTIFSVQAGAILHYNEGWQSPVEPIQASGGQTVDAEARQMLLELIEALKKVGIFASST